MNKKVGLATIIAMVICGCFLFGCAEKAISQNVDNPNEEKQAAENVQKNGEIIFRSSLIDEKIEKRIKGVSWKEGAPVDLEDLRYLEITYEGFDNQAHIGEMVVNKYVADEVLKIFKELYEAKYQIEKMNLIDDYGAKDSLSMADNNSSSFCYRVVEGTSKLSKHAYGIAIDINPLNNPYVKDEIVEPVEAMDYVDRSILRQGMIMKDDPCYEAFSSRGWTWGGDWNSLKDYQHFQKDIEVDEL